MNPATHFLLGWAIAVTACADRRERAFVLLGDLLGSRGPDGYRWPTPYLLPFSETWQSTWSGPWADLTWCTPA